MKSAQNRGYVNWGKRQLQEIRNAVFSPSLKGISYPSFWMKNTHLALDIIFLDSNRTIVGIVPKASPMSETLISIETPSRYVLEVHAGFSANHGVKVGDTVEFRDTEI